MIPSEDSQRFQSGNLFLKSFLMHFWYGKSLRVLWFTTWFELYLHWFIGPLSQGTIKEVLTLEEKILECLVFLLVEMLHLLDPGVEI